MEIYDRYFFNSTDSIIITKVSKKWYQKNYVTNKSGFRDNIEYEKTVSPGKRRITFLGDSFVAGQGIKVEERFSNIIRNKNSDWEIHSLAIPGWNTADEINIITSAIISGYRIDVVVLVYFSNDISDLNSAANDALSEAFKKVHSNNWFIRNSYTLDHFYFRFRFLLTPEIKNYSYDVLNCYQGEIWKKQKQRLLKLKKIIEDNNGRLMVVTFPYMQDLSLEKYPHKNMHDILNQFWVDNKVPHFDLLDIFKKNEPRDVFVLNRYDAHPNANANSLAAAGIERFLKRSMTIQDNLESCK